MGTNSVHPPDNLSTSLSFADKTTSASIKNQKNFASKAYNFINSKIPTNLKLLFKENPQRFGLFVLTCVVTSAAVAILSAVAITAFVTGNYGLGIAAGLGAVGIGFAGYKFGSNLLTSVSDLKENSATMLKAEYNECRKENIKFNEKVNILQQNLVNVKYNKYNILKKLKPVENEYKELFEYLYSKYGHSYKKLSEIKIRKQMELVDKEYHELKNEKSSAEALLNNIINEISEQQQKIQYNELKMMRIKTVVKKYPAEYSADILKDKSDEKINDKNINVSFNESNN